jgi:hypothetical protein
MDLTPHIQDDEERHRIASRAPVDVFVPDADPERYVSDYSGDYWPYRAMTYADAKADTQAAERTVSRTLSFQLTDTRHPGANFPADLFALADDLGADAALPAVYTGSGRSALRAPVESYHHHDFANSPDFIIPAPAPHGLTLDCINNLTTNAGAHLGIRDTTYPTDIALRDLRSTHTDSEALIETIQRARRMTSGDVNIQLYEPPLSTALVNYIATNPNAVDSIILPQDAETLAPATESPATDESPLSAKGRRGLSNSVSPLVRVAAEFSLLTSSYIDDVDRHKALAKSLLPSESTPHHRHSTPATEPQQTLTFSGN